MHACMVLRIACLRGQIRSASVARYTLSNADVHAFRVCEYVDSGFYPPIRMHALIITVASMKSGLNSSIACKGSFLHFVERFSLIALYFLQFRGTACLPS
jgi:hypothetical protein